MTGLEQVNLEVSPVRTRNGQSQTPRPRLSVQLTSEQHRRGDSSATISSMTTFRVVAYFTRPVSFFCVDITETMYLFEPT